VRHRNNRRKRDGFAFPAPFTSLVAVAASLGLAYIWLSCRCEALGRDIKALEAEGETLQRRLLNEQCRWTRLKSPENMERALAALKIVMVWPRREQVVYLHEEPAPAPESGAPGRDALTYVRRGRIGLDD